MSAKINFDETRRIVEFAYRRGWCYPRGSKLRDFVNENAAFLKSQKRKLKSK